MAHRFFRFRARSLHFAVPFYTVERLVSAEEIQPLDADVLLYRNKKYRRLDLRLEEPLPTSSPLLLLKDGNHETFALQITQAIGIERVEADVLHPLPEYIFAEASPILTGCFSASEQLIFTLDIERLQSTGTRLGERYVHRS